MKRALILRLALVLFLTAFLPSCGSEFRSAWKKAPVTSGAEGRWDGTWHSAATGHTGTLRCVISEPVNQKGGHEFFYRATWKKILSGSYKAVHAVQKQKDGTYTFKGEHKMPDWAGGLYHYQGTIKGDTFNACYESAMDRGTYTMKRMR